MTETPEENMESEPKFTDSTNFTQLAKDHVAAAFNYHFMDSEKPEMASPENFYVVWFAFTLGHWKALVSTDIINGLYWEVTHNSAKNETYVDTYNKVFNHVVRDVDAPLP